MREIKPQIQKAQKTPTEDKCKENHTQTKIVKLLKSRDNENILKAQRKDCGGIVFKEVVVKPDSEMAFITC